MKLLEVTLPACPECGASITVVVDKHEGLLAAKKEMQRACRDHTVEHHPEALEAFDEAWVKHTAKDN